MTCSNEPKGISKLVVQLPEWIRHRCNPAHHFTVGGLKEWLIIACTVQFGFPTRTPSSVVEPDRLPMRTALDVF